MTEGAINTLALWVLIPSGVLSLVLMLMVAVDAPRSVVRRRRQRQRADLEQALNEVGRGEPTLDWMRFKDVPKQELVDMAGKRGWHYSDQEVRGNSWLLRFTKDLAYRSNVSSDPRQRLRRELGAARSGIDGTYRLDATQYADVPRPELLRLAQESGWQEVRAVVDGVLLRPASADAAETPESFLRGPSLEELRNNPQVAHRASVLESRLGFDPLSHATANHARGRHNHYIRLIRRNALLGVLYAMIALLGLITTFGALEPSDGANWYVSLGVTLIMIALFVVSMLKVRVFSRQRNREIGDFVEAYQQLKQVHEGTLPTSSTNGIGSG